MGLGVGLAGESRKKLNRRRLGDSPTARLTGQEEGNETAEGAVKIFHLQGVEG